jgi:hypothetical protein
MTHSPHWTRPKDQIHEHLGMVMPNDEYILTSNVGIAYDAPADPPQVSAYAGTAAIVSIMQENYHREVKNYEEYQDQPNHIKAMMLQVVPKVYTGALAHTELGYANVTPNEIMTHLQPSMATLPKVTSSKTPNSSKLHGTWTQTLLPSKLSLTTAPSSAILQHKERTISSCNIFPSGCPRKSSRRLEKKPKAEKPLFNVIMHFTAASEHRLTKLAKSSKEVLTANSALEEMKALLSNAQKLDKGHQACKQGKTTNPRGL